MSQAIETKTTMSSEEVESTTFLGVKIDTINGPTDPRIKKALERSASLLDILKFIKVVKFKLNMTMFDYFWQVMVGNTRVHLVSRVLEWFGYEGELKEQRKNFIRMLKRNDIAFNELTQQDPEIEQFPTIQEELQLIPSNVTNSKFLIMEPDDLKMAIMQLKTKNGHTIRQYYIDLEELLKLYVEYTLYFNHRESQRKITDLEKMMADMRLEREEDRKLIINLNKSNKRQERYMKSMGLKLEEVKDQNEELLDHNKGLKYEVTKVQRKLGIAVEDRAPLPDDVKKQERFILLKTNDPKYWSYYTIRAQNCTAKRALKTKKDIFPKMKVLLDLKYNPNSKTLYTRIKDELRAKNVTFKGNNIDLEDSLIDEEELIEIMKGVDEVKYDV